MRLWTVVLLLVGIIVVTEARRRYGGRGSKYRPHYRTHRPGSYPGHRPHYPGHHPYPPGCRYTRVDCRVSAWHGWSSCSDPCGSTGTRHRVRYVVRDAACGGRKCPVLVQKQPCNRFCKNGGTPRPGSCSCRDGYKGKCCEIAPSHGHCHWTPWCVWSACSKKCGCGTKTRARTCKCDHYGNRYHHCYGNSKEEIKCNCHACYGPQAKFVPVGCYADKHTRALPNFVAKFHGNTSALHKIGACAHLAAKLHVGYFGMQDGGECWVDLKGHNHYDKYGKSLKCKDGLGGGWTNSVYRML